LRGAGEGRVVCRQHPALSRFFDARLNDEGLLQSHNTAEVKPLCAATTRHSPIRNRTPITLRRAFPASSIRRRSRSSGCRRSLRDRGQVGWMAGFERRERPAHCRALIRALYRTCPAQNRQPICRLVDRQSLQMSGRLHYRRAFRGNYR